MIYCSKAFARLARAEINLPLQQKDTALFYLTDHFRMSGVYWGVTALSLLAWLDLMDEQEIISWVLSCQHETGGFGGSENNDPHLLYTLSAVQILALYGALDRIDGDAVAACEYNSHIVQLRNFQEREYLVREFLRYAGCN